MPIDELEDTKPVEDIKPAATKASVVITKLGKAPNEEVDKYSIAMYEARESKVGGEAIEVKVAVEEKTFEELEREKLELEARIVALTNEIKGYQERVIDLEAKMETIINLG